jgi:hypothetical protein
MSYGYPIVLKSDKLARSQMQEVSFYIKITGAKTNASLALINNPLLPGYDAADLTQTLVEAFLGHTSTAPCSSIFDSTSMGTDAFGAVIDMAGQCDILYGVQCTVVQTAGGTPANSDQLIQASQGGMTGTSLTSACASYDGDVYIRVIAGNLDSATAGYLRIRVLFKAK